MYKLEKYFSHLTWPFFIILSFLFLRSVEMTLEGMSTETEVDTDLDYEPISQRAQLLKNALQDNQDHEIQPDINALWETFKRQNESYESSMNSARTEAVTNLLRNPTHHMVQGYMEERNQYRVERHERAELGRELRVKEQQELHQSRHSSSEDDFGSSYTYMLLKKEEERQKRRLGKKKKGKNVVMAKEKVDESSRKGNNAPESLFSIAEDSFEQSPTKVSASPSKARKAKSNRQQNVIDPNMRKLRERIANQRHKIDKSSLRELQRWDKLKKLEHLLASKQKGEINDDTLEQHLDEISSTTQKSENSIEDVNNTGLSDDSTTAKDSSAEMHRWKAAKEQRLKETMLMEKALKDRNNSEHRSKKNHDMNSELKLLQLVTEGHLTAKEAYKLALERASFDDESPLDENSFSKNYHDLKNQKNGRRHKSFSPYERDTSSNNNVNHYKSKLKKLLSQDSNYHIPKLRFSDLDIEENLNKRKSRPKSILQTSSNRQDRSFISQADPPKGDSSRSPIRSKESRNLSERSKSRSPSGSRIRKSQSQYSSKISTENIPPFNEGNFCSFF